MKFDDILEKLESDGKILDFKFSKNKMPMYLMVRSGLIQLLINKEFNLSNPHIKANSRSINEMLKYIYHTLKSNIFFAPKKDIYIFSSGIVNKLEGSKYINRLYDKFNQSLYDKTQIIEGSVKLGYLMPKKENIYFKDIIDIIIVLISKVIKVKDEDFIEIEKLIIFLEKSKLFEKDDLAEIKYSLIKWSKRIDFSYWIYRQLLKIKKPKLIIVEDGHYFGHTSLLQAAKSLGINTAEYQHGYVGLAHPAYNYHKNIFGEIKEYLPEYLLTHGEYWSSVTRTPSEKVAIGLADLSNKIEKLEKIEKETNTILFISGGTVYKTLNKLIKKSFVDLKELGYTILLRPHPSELPALEERYSNLINMGIKIDTVSLYDTLQKVDIVVGMEVSTVLYEAVCFSDKIYLMNTGYTKFYEPKTCFLSFTNKEELIQNIKEEKTLNHDANYFWDNNWKKNYINFIENTIGIQNDNNN